MKNNTITATSGAQFVGMAPLGDTTANATGGVISNNFFTAALFGNIAAASAILSNFPYTWTLKDNIGQLNLYYLREIKDFLEISK